MHLLEGESFNIYCQKLVTSHPRKVTYCSRSAHKCCPPLRENDPCHLSCGVLLLSGKESIRAPLIRCHYSFFLFLLYCTLEYVTLHRFLLWLETHIFLANGYQCLCVLSYRVVDLYFYIYISYSLVTTLRIEILSSVFFYFSTASQSHSNWGQGWFYAQKEEVELSSCFPDWLVGGTHRCPPFLWREGPPHGKCQLLCLTTLVLNTN